MNTCDKCISYTIKDNECSCPKIIDTSKNYFGEDDIPQDAAGVSDCEGYAANFHPMPKFGCIHWSD